jgi:spore coat protein CotH
MRALRSLLVVGCWVVCGCEGTDPEDDGGFGAPSGPPTVVISEIMYHPVDEVTETDEHEFIELENVTANDITLDGYRLVIDGRDRFVFPEGVTLPAGQRLVLANRRDAVLGVSSYGLSAATVAGEFSGELDNGGAEIALLDAHSRLRDLVRYEDHAPWPIGADAFGAQEAFLPGLAPYSQHRFMGRSLERVDGLASGNDPANWEASAVDGATPGRENSVLGRGGPVVLSHAALPEAGGAVIGENQAVRVRFDLSGPEVSDPALEYRMDPVERIGSSVVTVPLTQVTDTRFEAVIPGTAQNTVVRYRILGRRGQTPVARFGPRATDPMEWYAYFVSPELPPGPAHQLFIQPEAWGALWENLDGGELRGCDLNPNWDATAPAVFVHAGKVYDVRVRYQGSRYRRTDGLELPSFDAPGPTSPSEPRLLSFHVIFPRYDAFEGERSINLNKLKQACPGVLNVLEAKMFERVGIPTQKFRFVRFYINGGYYNYALEVRNLDEEMLSEGGRAGDLFKSDGDTGDGVFGRGNFTPLEATCDRPAAERYAHTYARKSNEWKSHTGDGHAPLIDLIEGLAAVETDDDADPAARSYFETHFDLEQLLTKFALRNWAGVWDDGFHNFYVYQRPADGKWLILPQDYDCDFGGDPEDCGDGGHFYNESHVSFFHPERGDGFTAGGSPELALKIQLFKAFRAEYSARVDELGAELFSEAAVDAMLAEVMAGFDRAAWEEAPVRYCDLDARIAQAKAWLAERREFLASGIE